MNTKFKHALILAIALAVFNLVMFLAGFQSDNIATGQHLSWLTWLIQIVVLWLGIKAVREEAPNKALNYGQGVATGVLISLYGGLMAAVYNFIHFNFINPDFFERQMELIKGKWAEAGMSADQMEKAESIARKLMGPVSASVSSLFGIVIVGTILSLILAAILKRPASEVPPQESSTPPAS